MSFSVTATGVPTPTFQWRKDGAPLAGATGTTLALASAQASDAGSYSVVVTNRAGTVTSGVATLRVFGRSYAGSYFGSIGTIGFFAIQVRDDNTGVFLGYLTDSHVPFVTLDVAVDDNGHFNFSTTANVGAGASAAEAGTPPIAAAPVAFTFDGTISATGQLSGSISGAASSALTATRAADNGATGNVAGFYQASAAGSSATTYTIVSPAGQALVLTQTSAGADAGTGTADAAGRVVVKTANNQNISATIASDSSISTQVTSAAGQITTFAGATEAMIGAQRFINVSTRATVGTGSAVTIAGLVIGGQDAKTVLLRVVGPGLAPFGVTGTIAKPRLQLYSGQTVIATNTGWGTAANASDIAAAAAQAGAFALPAGSADSALLMTLAPGAYTVVASGADGGSGAAIVEAYDLTPPAAGQKMINISTRAQVGSGNVCIAGFVVSGTVPKRVLLRGVGPSLANLGISGALTRPQLTLYRGSTVMAQNAGWAASADAAQIAATGARVGAFVLASNDDAALLVSLDPGAYTMQLSGVGTASGIALVEVYEVP